MGNVELPKWLKELPLAPEFRPTDTEFADPIAYISKIEKEVGAFGICKVIPPLPKPSKRYVFNNLNKTLLRTRELGLDLNLRETGDLLKRNDNESRAVFTTRQQELGRVVKRSRDGVDASQPGAQKQVWQSGELYTLEQFESKSKAFSRSVLGSFKEVTPLAIEALFWKAASEKPIYVEYANDVPGSGFGEPEGLSGYIRACKKRSRICGQSHGGRSYLRRGVDDATNLCAGVGVDGEALVSSSSSLATLGNKCLSRISSVDEVSQSSKQRDLCADAEVEGTAGWKLSNCPWNLQVIARSAGSLTRFMLDDIPGVTSPMVYIGMLFSWFAWHVEDHELHSLNFLHTGSPKTWYAVPGEYAFAFEDLIRKQAYGGDIEHLAALKLLGEKTTLLSPEIVVASGIPCCRVVQYPGEFVVTFPRAYHIGFSHGFNCGEAANFGTPQWLTIAKEAAVRRAAMDHLPMLSHQQLLYLLTMSFILSVPRTLLPGVRSSRLRNRLKDERELLVKKAFIEDVLKENYLLTTVLGKDTAFRAVLWHPDSLPSFTRSSLSQSGTLLDAVVSKDAELPAPTHKDANEDIHYLNSYKKTSNGLYVDSNDILGDFQVDSGTLVCVACGILGYPIMAVVQPSKKASETFLAENISMTGAIDISRQPDSFRTHCSTTNNDGTWDSSGFLRPRIFCLEHAVQTEELLRPRGGAKMLLICHSDYQKIKANAVAVAEELRTSFNYKEAQFDSASQKELNLIDVAIDGDQLTDFQEDWTSKLGINLRFSVRNTNGCLPTKIEHVLNIDYLLSMMAPGSRILNIKWCSRKSRTKRESSHRTLAKCSDVNLMNKDEILHAPKSMETKQQVLLQYSRRKYRNKSKSLTGAKLISGCSMACKTEVMDANDEKIDDSNEQGTLGALCYKNAETDSREFDTPPEKGFVVYEEGYAPEASREPTSNRTSEMVIVTEASTSRSSDSNFIRIAGVNEESNKAIEDLDAVNCSSSPATVIPDAGISVCAGMVVKGENVCIAKPVDLSEEHYDELAGRNLRVSNISDPTSSAVYALEATTESSVRDNSVNKLEAYAKSDLNMSEKLGESETRKHDITTVDVDMFILPKGSLTDKSQTGVRSSKLSTTQERKGKRSANAKTTYGDRSKRRKMELQAEAHNNFIKSPCEGLRPRRNKVDSINTSKTGVAEMADVKSSTKKLKKCSGTSSSRNKVPDTKTNYSCSLEGCRMFFRTKAELSLHKRNKCHHKECGKSFRSHKYVVLHQRVHDDERPLKCSWTGCTMTFKWAWARTEHLRLHTGERPYQCKIKGCGLTFRFVSDYSRHRRKTGHYVTPPTK